MNACISMRVIKRILEGVVDAENRRGANLIDLDGRESGAKVTKCLA